MLARAGIYIRNDGLTDRAAQEEAVKSKIVYVYGGEAFKNGQRCDLYRCRVSKLLVVNYEPWYHVLIRDFLILVFRFFRWHVLKSNICVCLCQRSRLSRKFIITEDTIRLTLSRLV